MSLEALASEHCANWQAGKCTGTETHVDGVETRFLPEGTRCLLAQGKQCRYFEVAVLPMEHWDWKVPAEGRQFAELAHKYRIRHQKFLGETEKKKCAGCGKRVPMLKKEIFCHSCKAARKTEQDRESQSKSREKGV